MKWNPFFNALAAFSYIVVVVLVTHVISIYRHDTPDTILDGLGILSLFTISAAVMAYLFFYQPALYVLENKRAEALSYFFKTIGIFGLITTITLILVTLQ